MRKLVCLLLLTMLILTMAITCAPPKAVAPTEEAAPELMLIVPNEVRTEFEDNAAAAKAKYKDKLVKVQGRVHEKIAFFDEHGVVIYSFELGERMPFCDTVCWFKTEQEVAALHLGDKVTIVGTFGDCSPGRIYLEDCRVTEQE